MSTATCSYDDVAYPGVAHAQTRPDSLAAIAVLHGLDPAPVAACRVLELGCGDGRNLVPLAFALPGATFVGLDLAKSAIDRGRLLVREAGVTNVALETADLLEWQPPAESFDYVIAHGFYSWVPPAVRDRLLEICRLCLSPHGVAFISYNTLPGGHVRRMLREILLFHTRAAANPAEKVAQARALLTVLAAVPPGPKGLAQPVQSEARWMLDRCADHVLFHDDLAPFNEPVTFTQFAEHAARFGLRFVAEADYGEMHDMSFPADVRQALAEFGADPALREQYRDFMKCRRFRQSIVCRDAAPVSGDADPRRVRLLSLASDGRPETEAVDWQPGSAVRFTSPRGPSVRLDHPLTKAALVELGRRWPRFVAFDTLVAQARERLAGVRLTAADSDVEDLAGAVVRLFASGYCELSAHPPTWSLTATERPAVNPVARAQIRCGDPAVASLWHENVAVQDPVLRGLIGQLDGTRDRRKLAQYLSAEAAAGRVDMPKGLPREAIDAEVNRVLDRLAADALLVS
jgi:SAM-dependent methyltransferase